MSETGVYPWPPAAATGVGSLPGRDPAEAMRIVFGELPRLPFIAELPGRGPGAEPAGRTAALLVDLPVETTLSGWRFASRPGGDLARARRMLSADLDALEEAAAGYAGALKIQVCGPWTLAAAIELSRSQDPALADPGAVADLTESLAEGVRAHIVEVRKRVPGAVVVLQLDESSLPMVLSGDIPTASGLNRVPAPEHAGTESALRHIISAAGSYSLVYCGRPPVPFGVFMGAGAHALGFSLATVGREDEEPLAEAAEAGLGIFAGVTAAPARPGGPVPLADSGDPGPSSGEFAAQRGEGGSLSSAREAAGRLVELWRRMGWPLARRGPGATAPAGAGATAAAPGETATAPGRAGLTRQVVLTPSGGLGGTTPQDARRALACCQEAAGLLPELIEEGPW